MSKNLVDEINSRGLANGSTAQRLAEEAKQSGKTMAELWDKEVENLVAYSVPATCTRIVRSTAYYTFSDGSEGKYELNKHPKRD